MGQSQKKKDLQKQVVSQQEIEKASKAVAEKCMMEISDILDKYNCTLEVKHIQDVIMGQPVLKYGPVVVHHIKPVK